MSRITEWQPSAPLQNLKKRASILAGIRAFFAERGLLEIETPALSRAALSDPHIESFVSHYFGPEAPAGCELYLHTSPEFPMKRLLAAGSGPIYQLCKVFRQGESGRRHNPEFTMLEWYRPGWDHQQLMVEVEQLVVQLLSPYCELAESEQLSYQQAFLQYVGLDPFVASVSQLQQCAEALGISISLDDELSRDDWLNLILSHAIEPKLGRGRLTFLCDYPPSQAALAKVRRGNPDVAERFELYLEGIELANGFHELVDAEEQQKRFVADNQQRLAMGLPQHPLDEALLQALGSGMPPSAGVALGVDRLVMRACGASSIDEVISFALGRA